MIENIYISKKNERSKSGKVVKPYINVWRKVSSIDWMVHSYKQTPRNLRRASQLQAALAERERKEMPVHSV